MVKKSWKKLLELKQTPAKHSRYQAFNSFLFENGTGVEQEFRRRRGVEKEFNRRRIGDQIAVLACCVEMPIWNSIIHKMAFHAQHNTQIHTQSKITKIAKNTQKYTSFKAIFWTFLVFLEYFKAEKSFGSVFEKLSFIIYIFQTTKYGLISGIRLVKIQVFKGQNQPKFSDHGMVNSGLEMTESLFFVYKSQNFSAQYTIIHKTQYTNTIHTNTAIQVTAYFFKS